MSNDPKKRGLGRGLAALLANTSGEQPTGPNRSAGSSPHSVEERAEPARSAPHLLALDALAPNPHQPRGQFDPDSLAELAESIRVHGIIQPLVVTPVPEHSGQFWIIAGERRWRAARIAGLDHVPVLVRAATAQALTELALVENIQRDNLNAIEEALAYQALINDYGLTQGDVAERVGKSRSAIANTVRLLGLPPAAQEALLDGRIAAGHGRALLALPDADTILTLLGEVEQRQLSVRQAEALVKQWLEAQAAAVAPAAPPHNTPAPQMLAHWGELENRFRSALGTKVNLNRNDDGSGRLVVHFYSDEDLETIYQLIAGTDDGS